MDHRYQVTATSERVEAWSTIRLPFEPRGSLLDYRAELRSGLRGMRISGPLYAEYATPDDDFADLENVLLYNVGSGSYSHLTGRGLVCRRVRSRDGLHRVVYEDDGGVTAPFSGPVVARVVLPEQVGGSSPAHWWAALRPLVEVEPSVQPPLEFAISVEVGSSWTTARAVAAAKPMLDGLISALHRHDGSAGEHVTEALEAHGDGGLLWSLLNDPSAALLGSRRLVRPHGNGVAWNPADELCAAFRIVPGDQSEALAISVRAAV